MGISFKMGKGSVCGVYTSLKPMIHFDSKQSQSIFNQNYYKNAMANNCKQCSIRIISHTTTPLPKAYDCVAVYIAGRPTSLVVYGWWPQPPTKKDRLVDAFTVPLYNPYLGMYLPAFRAVQQDYQWPLENSGNSHRSHGPRMHCNYLNQPIKRGWCQPIGGHVPLTVLNRWLSALREAVPSHAGPLSGPLFKQWNLLLSFV